MGHRQTKIERVAIQAVDPDRLLEGEDPSSMQMDDADHWTRVYEDLLAFKRGLLQRADEITPEMEEDSQVEVGRTDLTVLAAERARFERRLAFWRKRAAELRERSR